MKQPGNLHGLLYYGTDPYAALTPTLPPNPEAPGLIGRPLCSYHFWMSAMKRRPLRSGNQYLHRESDEYRNQVCRKLAACHGHIQLGVIAQGILQCLSVLHTHSVWRWFGSWLRTIRPGIPPSEQVVAIALRRSLPAFLSDSSPTHPLAKFIRQHFDLERAERLRLAS